MGGKNQQPVGVLAADGAVLRRHEQPLHELRRREVQYIAGAPYVGANVLMMPGPGGYLGEFMAWDRDDRQEGLGDQGAVSGLERRARHRRRGRVLRDAGRLVQGGRRRNRRAPLEVQAAAPASIGNPITYIGPGREAVRRDYSGVGGWFGLPVAANLSSRRPVRSAGGRRRGVRSGPRQGHRWAASLHVFALE